MIFPAIFRFSAATVVLAAATPSLAQTVVRGQGVADRARPLYDALGYDLGGFRLYPGISARAEATDNLRATDTNRISDVALIVEPDLRIASEWTRHRIGGRAFYNRSFYARQTGENTSGYGADFDGLLDVSRDTQIRANIGAARLAESRSSLGSFQNAIAPVRYTTARAGASVAHRFDRLSFTAGANYEQRNFDDALLGNGTVFDQDYRDVNILAATGSVQYELRGGIGLLVSGQVDRSRYSARPGAPGFNPVTDIDRGSSGFSILGGISFELSSLVFGNVQVGMLNREYRDARLRNFSGLSYNANILWNVTPLTSLRARAQRYVEDTSSQTVAGNTRSDFSLGVDHELYRNIVLSGDASYSSFRPNGPGVGGKEYGVSGSARYLIDRHWSLTANVRHARRTSDSTFLRYNATSAAVAVRFAF